MLAFIWRFKGFNLFFTLEALFEMNEFAGSQFLSRSFCVIHGNFLVLVNPRETFYVKIEFGYAEFFLM